MVALECSYHVYHNTGTYTFATSIGSTVGEFVLALLTLLKINLAPILLQASIDQDDCLPP
jgi:hypothetical protein